MLGVLRSPIQIHCVKCLESSGLLFRYIVLNVGSLQASCSDTLLNVGTMGVLRPPIIIIKCWESSVLLFRYIVFNVGSLQASYSYFVSNVGSPQASYCIKHWESSSLLFRYIIIIKCWESPGLLFRYIVLNVGSLQASYSITWQITG